MTERRAAPVRHPRRDSAPLASEFEPRRVYTPMIEVSWPGTQARKPSSPQAQACCLKCENLQPMGAFKIRGAFNMIAQLPKEQLERGVITYSSGNHGQAVALAAQKLGAPAVIVMPTTAPQVKIDGCKSYGAEVIMAGTTSLDRQARAEQEARDARPDDRAAVRSPADHHRPGHDGPRDPRAVPGRRHRVRAGRRRRASRPAWRRRSSDRSRRCASSRSNRSARRR